ncbi:glycoside hydrolase family 30 beta sandwich domain-containing protein [Cytobacillus firmus]
MNNHLEAWIDWNLVLNEEGRPYHVGNYCDAPVIVDTKKDEVHYNSSYYYIGHFSKFIKPVARRIGSQASNNRILATAFEYINGETVVVLMNGNDSEEEVYLSLGGKSMKLVLPEHAIATIIIH